MTRRRWLLVAAMVLGGVLPAAAQAPSADRPAPAPTLRGAAPAAQAAPPPWSLRPAPSRPDPGLASPGLRIPAAPRVEGFSAAPVGGAACRTACATNLYVCQGGEAGDHCQREWSACVLACPTASGAL